MQFSIPAFSQYPGWIFFGIQQKNFVLIKCEQNYTHFNVSEFTLKFDKPSQFDKAAEKISLQDVEEKIDIITDTGQLFNRIAQFEKLQVNRVSLHNINRNHEEFITAFGEVYKKYKY